jgi:hypothetical protein
MRYLKTNTATIVTVGPFLDKTDGVTLETALTITNERISFTVDLNNGSAPTLVLDNVTGATSGTSNDLNYITNCDAGLMQLELAAANVNYVGRGFLTITDAANHCPVFHEFTILPAQVYDSLVLGTDLLQADTTQIGGTAQTARDLGASVLLSSGTGTGQLSITSGVVAANATQISGDATAADNAESFFDGTGYAGTNNVIPLVTTTTTATNLTNLPAAAATAAELAKVPKSDSTVTWNATALASINAEVDTALNTAIPGSPTANSVNERVAAMDDKLLGTVAAGTHTAQTGDSFARIGAPAGASVSADVAAVKAQTAAIETDTQDLQAQVGTDGAGLTALPWNAAWDTEVQSEAQDAITASALATAAAVADVPTVAEFEARTLVAANYATAAALTTIDDFLDTEVAAILADTNELQTDWANGGRLDLILDIIAADTTTDIPALISDVPTVAEFEARTLVAAGYATPTNITAGTITTVTNLTNAPTNGDLTATMKASVTAAVPSAATIQSGLATAAALAVVDGIVDDILVDTGTTLDALVKDIPTNAELATALSTADDAILAILGTPANIDSGGATIADNLKKIADDNGGASFDATVSSLNKLSTAVVTGVAATLQATANAQTTGTLISGTYASTYLSNGTSWVTAPVTPAVAEAGSALSPFGLNVNLLYTAGANQTINSVSIRGNFAAGTGRYCNVYAYNYITSTWDMLSDVGTRMNNTATLTTYTYTLLSSHQKTDGGGDGVGAIRIGFKSPSTNTGDRLNVDLALVNVATAGASAADIADAVYAKLATSVYGRQVWIDTVSGVDGYVIGVNGLDHTPVLTIACAYQLCDDLGLKTIAFKSGSNAVAVTLTRSAAGWRFYGPGKIALNGQNIADAIFDECYSVYGTSTGDDASFYRCQIGSGGLTLDHAYVTACRIKGAITLIANADPIIFHDCIDATGAAADFELIFVANATAVIRNFQGAITLKSMAATNSVVIDGALRVIIDASCTAGSITVRGFAPALTGAAAFIAAGGTITQDARYSIDAINAEADSALADYDGPTNAEFEARTLPAADYTVVSDLPVAPDNASIAAILVDTGTTLDTLIKDVPTVAEFEARTIAAANYATAAALDAVDNFVDTEVAAIKAVTDKLDTALVLDGAVYQLTANALELAPTGGSAPTVVQIRQEMDSNSTQLAAILADTNELQTDWKDGGRLDLILDAAAAGGGLDAAGVRAAVGLASANLDTQLADLPTNAELAAGLAGADDATLAAIAALNNLSSAQAQTAATAALNAYDPPTKAELDSAVSPLATAAALAAVDTLVKDVPTNAELAAALATADDAVLAAVADVPTVAEMEARTLPSADYVVVGDTLAGVTTVGSVTTKTGYKLASDGLDAISTTAPVGVATNFREMVVQTWRRFFKGAQMTATSVKTYDDTNLVVVTTQTLSDDGTTQVQGPAT